MLLSLSQPPHLPWGQPSQSLPQPAPKQANGGFRVFSLLGNLLNQHQRAAPPPLPGSSLQTFQSSLVWITSTASEWALTGRPFLIRKQFLQHKKCLWEDRDAADKKWCFVTVNWNWALWFSCYKFFNFSWVQHGKELSQKGLFFFSLCMGLVAEHSLRTTWTLPKLYGSWAELPGSTAQRREWDPNPRQGTADFNVKQTWN